jgi:peroxiredoxin
MRPSSVAIVAGVILAGFTVWITRQAKALERDLDVSSQKIALLGKPAPDFHLTSSDGRTVSLAEYHGRKKLALVFWASWNNGSHPEMLMLGVMYQRTHTPDSDFDIVGIAVDDNQAAVKQFAADSKLPFPLVLDRSREVANAYQIRSLPTALIVDTDGKVIYGNVGFAPGRQNDFARQLGIRPGDFRMEMGAPRGRGN